MAVEPSPKTLWLKRFAREYHCVQLQLTADLRLHRISGLQRVERRRRLGKDGDLLGGEQGMKFFRYAGYRLGHHDQPPAVQQRAPHFADRYVEGQGMPQ